MAQNSIIFCWVLEFIKIFYNPLSDRNSIRAMKLPSVHIIFLRSSMFFQVLSVGEQQQHINTWSTIKKVEFLYGKLNLTCV